MAEEVAEGERWDPCQVSDRASGGGFIPQPDAAHVQAARDSIRRLAEVVSEASATEEPVHGVDIGWVQHTGILSPLLYGFHIAEPDDDGELKEVFAPGTRLRYAVVLNQPVDRQVTTVLTFVASLVSRQAHLATEQGKHTPIEEIEQTVARLDQLAEQDVTDFSRYGWEATAMELGRRARDAGFPIHLGVVDSLFSTREEVNARLPLVRALYNEYPAVKEAIDRTVSVLAGRGWSIVGAGGPEALRLQVQQQVHSISLRGYLAQCARDGMVSGNGYLTFVGDGTVYCLRPDEVSPGDRDDAIAFSGNHEERHPHVLHMRGLDQPSSKYGLSILEPFVYHLLRARTLARIGTEVAKLLKNATLSQTDRATLQPYLDAGKRHEQEWLANFEQVLGKQAGRMPPPTPGLYFPGQERL